MNAPAVRAVAPVSSMQLQTDIGGLSIQPQNFGEVISFAEHMAKSTFVPAHLRGKPSDCLAVCLQALRWGMDPFSVGQKTYFVKEGSAPGYEAQLIAAVVQSRAPLQKDLDIEWSGTWPNRICTITGYTRGNPKAKVRKVEAIKIKTRNSPLWTADPDQQLAYYSIRAWARLYTPATIMGVYGRDEMAAETISADNAVDVTPERPASNLDALEEIIGPTDPNIGQAPTAETIDADTGEIIEPEAVYDAGKEFDSLLAGAEAETTAPGLEEYWRVQREPDAAAEVLYRRAADLYNDLARKVAARLKLLKNGGGK